MTVKTDLAAATGVHRRLYLRIDGLNEYLWTRGDDDPPSWAGPTHRTCLHITSEFASEINIGEMTTTLSAMEFELDDIDVDAVKYWGQLFAPARWDENTHARCTAGASPETYIDADATTINVDSATAMPASGTAYMGQETLTYGGKTGTSLTTVQKGLYPCVDAAATYFGHTYKRPEIQASGAHMHVGTVPFSWVGRRAALYVHTWDKQTGDWRAEGETELLWVGRISDEIRQDGKSRRWVLSCTSILSDLEEEIAVDLPEDDLQKINLQGDKGRSFIYTNWDANGVSSSITVTIDKGVYTAKELVKEFNKQMAGTIGGWGSASTHPQFFLTADGKCRWWVLGVGGSRSAAMLGYTVDGFCHALTALGFKKYSKIDDAPTTGTHIDTGGYYDSYHPLNRDYNGDKLYVKDSDEFWADQGDNSSARAFGKIEDSTINAKSKFKGTYLFSYSAIDSGNNLLTLAEEVDGEIAEDAFAGQLAKDALTEVTGTRVKQVYIPQWKKLSDGSLRGPFELLLYSLLSTGTPNYQHATYDALPLALSVGMQIELVDTASFQNADKLLYSNPLAHRTAYVIDEGVSWATLAAREGKLFGFLPVWRRGKITLTNVLAPGLDRQDDVLDESNDFASEDDAEWPDMVMSAETVVNSYKVKANYDNTTGKFGPSTTIYDADSRSGLRVTKQVEIEHPGVYRGIKSSVLKDQILAQLMGRHLRYPSPLVKRTIAPTLATRVYVGDVVRFQSNRIADPIGTGTLVTNCLALVLKAAWNYEGAAWVGSVTLMLLVQDSGHGDPWAPSAVVKKSAANGGLSVANDQLTLEDLAFGEAGDTDDGAAFFAADEVLIIERSPADPTAPVIYGPYVCLKDYEADGGGILTLEAGAGAAINGIGWTATKEHIVTAADYADAPTAQRARGTWQASASTLLLDGTDRAQRYG